MDTGSVEQTTVEQPTATEQATTVAQPPAVAQANSVEQQPSTNLGAFDSLLKYIASFSLLLYCCGYLVASVTSLEWGFYEIAPFRPKVASAGAWFIFFLGVPIAATVFRSKRQELEHRANAAEGFLFYATWGVGLAFGTFSLFDSTVPPLHSTLTPLLLMPVFFILPAISGKGRMAITIKWVISLASILFVAGSGFYDLFEYHLVSTSAVFLWYIAIGFAFNFGFNMCKGRTTLENLTRGVPYVVSLLLLALSYFGRIYYPHIKASWGGGAPVSVTILFAKESPILPGQYLSTQLLDESDAGLYIAGKGEKRASFIPRNEIASITYSDSPSYQLQPKPK